MKQICFGLAIHNHQPLGNFPWVFEQAYRQSYLPLIEALERHPAIRVSLHYSGCLIDWLEQTYPEFLNRLSGLVERDQVEIMSGTYYEAILPSIPDADKLGQIAKMSDEVSRRFGAKPTGLWLAERVWEPCLVKSLAEAGVEWTLIDDSAFNSVGVDDNELFGYYITEEQGKSVKVFPISKRLRYYIPWNTVDKVIRYLSEEASDKENRIAIMGDDGEKFGLWPGTYDYCWRDQWVDKFFTALEKNRDWIHTLPLGECARQIPPIGRIYLPSAAYDEMLEWSLPSDKSWEYSNLKHEMEAKGRQDIIQFMHGGLWHSFLVKYPEINRMHKKMLRVHRKVHQACILDKESCGLEELWKAQCNCPYWHGVFGGAYLSDIRATTYSHLIQAEKMADKVIHRHRSWVRRAIHLDRSWLEWQKTDFDVDGVDELLVDGNAFSVYLSPNEGGSIFEWDLRYHNYNLFSTLARRPEAYHRALVETSSGKNTGNKDAVSSIHNSIRVKDEGSLSSLVYDRYLKSSLIDHFFSPDIRLLEFADCSYTELGDFVDQAYELSIDKKGDKVNVRLRRSGILHIDGGNLPFEIQKEIKLQAREEKMEISYHLKNRGDSPIEAVFGSEWNINLLGGGHNKQAYYEVPGHTLDDHHLDSWGELVDIEKVTLCNRHLGIELDLTAMPKVKLWRFPVKSISNSEGGVEMLYQGSCLLALLPFSLSPGEIASLDFIWQVRPPD